MFNINELIPQHKFDEDALNKLRILVPSEVDISPVIAQLFEWIQDINWPIAPELCKILASLKPEDIIPHIKMVLNSGDDCWQFSCICFLIPELPIEVKREIVPDLLRIIKNPTINEKLCEIDVDARNVYEDLIALLN
ncbi:DUF5071 domain-containing protein [Paenibacillus foliorum]|uniref:DUF5071 domain-containing protein n=1 Tax=Paenibacillus foliorum TaxID=2654974 RepID=UPI001492E25B|nr:DUF5071 domain-containing protein [Paenibacillus foliorum]